MMNLWSLRDFMDCDGPPAVSNSKTYFGNLIDVLSMEALGSETHYTSVPVHNHSACFCALSYHAYEGCLLT